jgi:hypothetical protein
VVFNAYPQKPGVDGHAQFLNKTTQLAEALLLSLGEFGVEAISSF